jgi:hypothetical protein
MATPDPDVVCLVFQANSVRYPPGHHKFGSTRLKRIEIKSCDIVCHSLRFIHHSPRAIEFFLANNRSYVFSFPSPDCLPEFPGIPQMENQMEAMARWRSGEITNYEYLWRLNLISGRSIHCIEQYPVMPWVVADYEASPITPDSAHRDLSKPIGAHIKNLEHLMDHYTYSRPDQRCHYSHLYSTSREPAFYLAQQEPFRSLHTSLWGEGRILCSVPAFWNLILDGGTATELIPEFFGAPEFFRLNVVLPKWSNSAFQFVILHRRILESSFVSAHIHQWIDLVFGYKQCDEQSLNVYPPQCYRLVAGSLKPKLANNQGYAPQQLWKIPHCERSVAPAAADFSRRTVTTEQIPQRLTIVGASAYESDHPVFVVKENMEGIGIFSRRNYTLWVVCGNCFIARSPGADSVFVHRGANRAILQGTIRWITALALIGGYVIVGSVDGTIEVWDIGLMKLKISSLVCQGAIVAIGFSPELSLIVCISDRLEVSAVDFFEGDVLWNQSFESQFDKVFVIREGIIILRRSREYLVLDLGGREFARRVFDADIACDCLMELSDFSCFLCAFLSSGTFLVLSDYDLAIVHESHVGETLLHVSSVQNRAELLLVTVSGYVFRVTFPNHSCIRS